MDNKLEWYVYRHDFNQKKIYHFNIFDHYKFFEDCCKNYKKFKRTTITIDEFLEQIKKDLQYYMWSKCEYEVVVSELFANEKPAEIKIDAYSQVMMNWKAFEYYILTNLDKFKIEKENK